MNDFIQLLLFIPKLMVHLHPMNFFFSGKWGIVWSMPLVFGGIVGFILFVVRDFRNRWPYLVGFLFPFIFTIGLDDGSSYGYRYFIPNLALCFLGLALLLDKLFEWKKGWIAILVVGFAALWQYIAVIQYRITLWWNDPQYTFKVLPVFFKTIKEGNLGAIILRPLSWFSMVFKWGFKIQSLTDAFFLLGIPVLFVFFLFLPVIVWYFGLHRKVLSLYPCRNMVVCALFVLGFFVVTDAVLLLENPPKTDQEKALTYRITGHRYLEKEEYGKAYGRLSVSKKLNKDDIETIRLLAHVLVRLDSLSRGQEILQEVIASGEENYLDYVSLAYVKLKLDDSRESVTPLLVKALEMTRDNPEDYKKVVEQIKKWGFTLE